jgi:hypothetical protein
MPDEADITWKDSVGKDHSQHVQITPLPPPTRTSYMGSVRVIHFVINNDGSVTIFYHHPGLND